MAFFRSPNVNIRAAFMKLAQQTKLRPRGNHWRRLYDIHPWIYFQASPKGGEIVSTHIKPVVRKVRIKHGFKEICADLTEKLELNNETE